MCQFYSNYHREAGEPRSNSLPCCAKVLWLPCLLPASFPPSFSPSSLPPISSTPPHCSTVLIATLHCTKHPTISVARLCSPEQLCSSSHRFSKYTQKGNRASRRAHEAPGIGREISPWGWAKVNIKWPQSCALKEKQQLGSKTACGAVL